MKFLFISNYISNSGAEIAMNNMIINLIKNNHSVWIYKSEKRSNYLLKINNLKDLEFSENIQNKNIFSLTNLIRTIYVIRLVRPDIINIHNIFGHLSSSVFFGIFLMKKKFFLSKIFYTIHDYSLFCDTGSFYNFRKKNKCYKCLSQNSLIFPILEKCYKRNFLYKFAKILNRLISQYFINRLNITFIVQSNLMKNYFEEIFKNKKIKILNHYMPLNNSSFDNISNNFNFNLLYLGRVSEIKGFFDLCSILDSIAKKNNTKYVLHVIGDFEKTKILSYSYLNINYLEKIPHKFLKKELYKYDICFSLSKWDEVFGLTILDCVINGIFPIVSNNGYLPNLIKSLDVGYICKEISEFEIEKSLKNAKKYFDNNKKSDLYNKVKNNIHFNESLYYKKFITLINE